MSRHAVPLPSPLDRVPFTTRSAMEEGVSPQRLRARDLDHPFRGVHAAREPQDLVARCQALATKLPPHVYFCGVTAAGILGVPLPRPLADSRDVHVGVPAGMRTLVGRGVRGHTYQISEPRVHLPTGLLLTSPARLWCELAVVLSIPDAVAAGDYLIHWESPLASLADLVEAAKRNPDPRGRRVLMSAQHYLNNRSESPQESKLRLIIQRAGITGWVANFWVTVNDGTRYRADLAFPGRRMIVEYQSAFHEGTEAFRRDMTRIAKLQAAGWFVMQVNADDLRNPDELADRIRDALALRPHFA